MGEAEDAMRRALSAESAAPSKTVGSRMAQLQRSLAFKGDRALRITS